MSRIFMKCHQYVSNSKSVSSTGRFESLLLTVMNMQPRNDKLFSLFIYLITGCGFMSVAQAESARTNTSSGNEFTISVSSYLYEEPSLGMSTKGDKFGVGHTGALVLNGDWFLKDDVRFANGAVDYIGSGYQAGVPDWYAEARGLIGRDIQFGTSVFAPYVGLGYRHLFNDLRGYSSDGSLGYRRESNYLYVPIGVTHRFRLQDSAVWASTFEFDKLLTGRQFSRLSDLVGHAGYSDAPDISNVQSGGFGFRADVMYETGDLAFGPYLNIWKIDKSDSVVRPITNNSVTTWYSFTEPQNRTTEFGMRMKFKF
ncbi:MAG: hypothetical protein FD121_1083 [Gallionellaceae bacterium]|nr:MAG: hypothetical protein FD121_1083 [Gallionellaceae bacterium]